MTDDRPKVIHKHDAGYGVEAPTRRMRTRSVVIWSVIVFAYLLGLFLTVIGIALSSNPDEGMPAAGSIALALGVFLVPLALSFIVSNSASATERRTLLWQRGVATDLRATRASVAPVEGPAVDARIATLEQTVSRLEQANRDALERFEAERSDDRKALRDAADALHAARHDAVALLGRRLSKSERARLARTGRLS